jgi:uncharacterized membrane protein
VKLYWSLKSIPELADMPKEQRKEVWRKCRLKSGHKRQSIIIAIMFAILGCIFGIVCSVNGYSFNKGLVAAIAIGFIFGFIYGQIEAISIRPHIREYLNSHDKI